MKVQTKALLKNIEMDNGIINFQDYPLIELEFSAIDTGGGFKDQILDFSFSISQANLSFRPNKKHALKLTIGNPKEMDEEIKFSYEGKLKPGNSNDLECNGRLHKADMSKKLIGFVLNLLR